MLQRITEELEYSSVLDMAAKTNNSWEQLAYVAAFTISSYSTTTTRVNKPFNPLLGETFECDRTDDLGWKSIAGNHRSDCDGLSEVREFCRASQPSSTGAVDVCRGSRMGALPRIHHDIEVSRSIS